MAEYWIGKVVDLCLSREHVGLLGRCAATDRVSPTAPGSGGGHDFRGAYCGAGPWASVHGGRAGGQPARPLPLCEPRRAHLAR